ncbi:hypothetical protein GAMM_230005 [Gammaproteobacteria bacterium]
MNNPAYILVEVFADIVTTIKANLNLAVLNYQFGYLDELNETLKQYSENATDAAKKYPLFWLVQPFTVNKIDSAGGAFYGTTKVRVVLFMHTEKLYKAKQRMDNIFKPVLIPIYSELLNQMDNHQAIVTKYGQRNHEYTERYYWGVIQQENFNDAVDCIDIVNLEIDINNNLNCSNFKSF